MQQTQIEELFRVIDSLKIDIQKLEEIPSRNKLQDEELEILKSCVLNKYYELYDIDESYLHNY